MTNSRNPYLPPQPASVDVEPVVTPRPSHGLLLLQGAVAALYVSVGISESNPSFRWAQSLIPPALLGPLLPVIPFIVPSIIYQQCVEKNVPAIPRFAAMTVSVILALVGLWGLLPLVQ